MYRLAISHYISLFNCTISVIFGLLASDNGTLIDRGDAIRRITEWESGYLPDAVTHTLFAEVDFLSDEKKRTDLHLVHFLAG